MNDAFEKVCLWLENEADGELYTLKELHEKMSALSNDPTNIYSIKSLKLKLQEKCRDYIYFSEMPGRENVISFRQMANLILSELKKKESQTKEDIIIAAAKIIKAEIRELKKPIDVYPTTAEISDFVISRLWIPEGLQTFLHQLVNSDTKRHCFKKCITQATWPRSIMCPLLFGLGVELDKIFGSKWVVDHISRLGYCISYDEILRYK